jgi:membrane associated rhomboid family serine protease
MFFPIRTDRRLHRTPWVNYTLIAANLLIFLFTRDRMAGHDSWIDGFILQPQVPQWWQFVTYQFLHADFMHVGGNMLFLFVFGNAVEDRLGKFAYLCFFLAGGVVAGLGHSLIETENVIGASGAVSAVTGAYLALSPLSNVTIVYWFFFIGMYEVPSFWVIGLQIAMNMFEHVSGWGGNVAYLAHLAGYAYGLAIGMGLLGLRLLPREPYDLMTLWEQHRRRVAFRALTRAGYQPWQAGSVQHPPQRGRWGWGLGPRRGDAAAQAPALADAQRQIMDLRQQIADAVAGHAMEHAAAAYDELLRRDGGQVMSQQTQLDLANHLMAVGNYDRAATAYELFLNTYASYPQREQVQLVLGLLCARYLERKQRAKELLAAALPRLHDDDQKHLAREVLAEIG